MNIVLLLAAPAGYMRHPAIPLILGLASWALFPVFLFAFKTGPLAAAVPIIVFNGLLMAFAGTRGALRRNILGWGSLFCEEEYRKNSLMAESLKLDSFENGMKFKELEIVSLYDITKKMSESLKIEAILVPFGSFLRENFIFKRCELLVLRQGGEGGLLDRRYEISNADGKTAAPGMPQDGGLDHERLIRFFIENPRELFLSRDECGAGEWRLREGVSSLAGIPLLSEKAVQGVLLAEDLQKKDLEKFTIPAMQFALEIKKALLYETVERLAITDSLTGLFLRRYFAERLEEEIRRSEKHALKFALLEIDIDDFKKTNDAHGHLAGDVIIKEVARLIKELTREIDIVSRYGGEEFAVLIEETGEEGAFLVADRLRKKIQDHEFSVYDEKLKITVSIGMSVYPGDARTAKALFEKADAAMYKAKNSGKNVVRKFGS